MLQGNGERVTCRKRLRKGLTSMDEIDKLSNKARLMSFLCACMVVFIHASSWVHIEQSHTAKVLTSFFCAGFCRIAVPFFFIASGYFLARHIGENHWWRHEVKKRVISLLVPLLIWNVAKAFCQLYGNDVCSISFSLDDILRILSLHPFEKPYYGVLWFVRALFLLMLYSFVINKFLGWPLVLACWIGWGLIYPDYSTSETMLEYTLFEGLMPLFCLTWFAFGMLAYKRKFKLAPTRRMAIGCLVFGLFLCGLKCWIQVESSDPSCVPDICRVMVWLMIPFSLLGTWKLLPDCRMPLILVKSTFPIYILHMFVFQFLERLASHVPVAVDVFSINTWHGIVLKGLAGIVFSIVIYSMMSRFATRFTHVVFGGR